MTKRVGSSTVWGIAGTVGGVILGFAIKAAVDRKRGMLPGPSPVPALPGEPYVEWQVSGHLAPNLVDNLLSRQNRCGMETYSYEYLPGDAKMALEASELAGQFASVHEFIGEPAYFDESYGWVPSALYFKDPGASAGQVFAWRVLYTKTRLGIVE